MPRLSPAATAFAAGAATLAVELLLPRMFARHLGTTIVPWTSVIAGALLGLAMGGALGGALADRYGARRTQAALLLAGAAASAALPWLDRLAEAAFAGLPLVPRALATVALTCLLPTIAWGGVGPACAREAAARAPLATGRALGRVSAASALGSLCGAFATGFVLVPSMGTTTAIAAVSAVAGIVGVARALEPEAAPAPAAGAPPAPVRGAPSTDVAVPIPAAAAGAIAVLCGASTLVLEASAGRRAGFIVGAGIYTWTSVIGAVLLGSAVGAAWGGRLADRLGPRRACARALMLASILVVLTTWTPWLLAKTVEIPGLPYPLRLLLGCALAWGLPSAALAAASPALARSAAAAAGEAHAGRAIGRLWALGTAGAVVGVLVTAPLLLPTIGHAGSFALLGIALALASGRLSGRTELPWIAGVALVFLCAVLPAAPARSAGLALAVREDGDDVFLARETALQHVRVEPVRVGERVMPRVRQMRIDGMVHGYVHEDDPTWLGYPYEGIYAAVTDRIVPRGRPPRAFFIGGGPYTFPRRLLATYPGAQVDVTEFDPGVTRAARDVLWLRDAPGLRIFDEDARIVVRDRPADAPKYDLVYGDAFNAFSVPFHLTTVEFGRAVKATMAPDGVYLVNVIDVFESGRFLGAWVETLSRVFAHVAVTSTESDDARQSTFVVIAADRSIDLRGLTRTNRGVSEAGEGEPVRTYTEAELGTLRQRARGLVLTDDHAPVENLLAPIVSRPLEETRRR